MSRTVGAKGKNNLIANLTSDERMAREDAVEKARADRYYKAIWKCRLVLGPTPVNVILPKGK